MNKICCIFEFQGFAVGGKFLVREFGWANMHNNDTGIVKIDLRPYMQGISQKDQSTIRYNEDRIHGLSFISATGEQAFDLSQLETKMDEIYNKCKKEAKDIVVYKGGEKKDVLAKCSNIPCMNIEKFGCPKYSELKKYHKGNTCGLHKKNLPCTVELVNAYRSWLLDNMKDMDLFLSDEDETDESE